MKKISWTDQCALETIKQLRNEFNIETFIETGTFKGINSFVQSNNFKYVLTCDINGKYISLAIDKLKDKKNVMIFKESSPKFLKEFIKDYKTNRLTEYVIIYLDAHFYDPKAKNKFVVLDELDMLRGFEKCIVIIHDFDNGMGHITYDNQPLNFQLIKERLRKVNPEFRYYTNSNEFSDIHTPETLKRIGLDKDTEAIDNIKYAWSNERLTKRGILYCVPKELDLNKYKLIEYVVET